jgi:hypothetical protein
MTAFDDPGAIVALVRRHGPYPSIASYLPPTATRGDVAAQTATTAPWFRANWAVAGRALFEDAAAILTNQRFIDAAAVAFHAVEVIPTTVVVNVNAPMPAGAVHVDIPSFHGATRDTYPLPLLQAMGTSGLFESWRILEAGAVTWFYDGPGGAYEYWPDGLDRPMCQVSPPYTNTALVADNDRIYHRIGAVGPADVATREVPTSSTIIHRVDEWDVVNGDRTIASYGDPEVRLSILWKARVRLADDHIPDPLTPDRVLDTFGADLARREIDVALPRSCLDTTWVDVVHRTYYPALHID